MRLYEISVEVFRLPSALCQEGVLTLPSAFKKAWHEGDVLAKL